jgi:tripartite-type tricarboxylate transporter receptor subunit TctC
MARRVAIGVLFGLTLFAPAAAAQSYPDRPIRLISPNPAGGANDTIVRIIAARMSPLLGGSFIIDNRGGAGGKIGAEAVARAAPDGYTLLAGSVSTHSFAPLMPPKPGYDPIKDFEPISLFALVQNVLVVTPSLPAASVSELIALAKAQPGSSITRRAVPARPAISPSPCSWRSPASRTTPCTCRTRAAPRP